MARIRLNMLALAVAGVMAAETGTLTVRCLAAAETRASAAGVPAATTLPDGRLEVLDRDSYVRFVIGLKTPVYATADGQIKTVTFGDKPVAEIDYVPAPATWVQPEFEDSAWF